MLLKSSKASKVQAKSNSLNRAGWTAIENLESRFLFAAGGLDTSFAAAGHLFTNLGFASAFATCMTVQSDGKMLVGGRARVGAGNDFMIARFNTDGSLDATFGSGGFVTTDLGSSQDSVSAIGILYGQIVVAGQTVSAGTSYDFAVARYFMNGTLDTSFGTGGYTVTDFSGHVDIARAMKFTSAAHIIVTYK